MCFAMFVDLNTFLNRNREKLGDKFEKVGSTNWYGTKRLISFDPIEGWEITELNIFQLFFVRLNSGYIIRIFLFIDN